MLDNTKLENKNENEDTNSSNLSLSVISQSDNARTWSMWSDLFLTSHCKF